MNFTDYIKHLSRFYYCICPEGNGIDSHRIWECYYTNTIPIMLKNTFTELLAEKINCVLLNDWNEINYNDISRLPIENNFNILNIDYYKNQILSLINKELNSQNESFEYGNS